MASKKKSSVNGNGERQRTRHFNDAACKVIAARISGELREYPKHLELWNKPVALNADGRPSRLASGGHAPAVPIWGPTFEAVTEKVNRLYHPEEAAVIIANLTA